MYYYCSIKTNKRGEKIRDKCNEQKTVTNRMGINSNKANRLILRDHQWIKITNKAQLYVVCKKCTLNIKTQVG